MWKQIVNTEDAICYEISDNNLLIRLEARYEDAGWVIYKGISANELPNYTEEYTAVSRDEAEKMINLLKKDNLPTEKELVGMIKRSRLKSNVTIKRAYKEEAIEKWYFTVNKDSTVNFVIARDFDGYELDIVLHEKFKKQEEDIVKVIVDTLSLDADGGIIKNVYYFSESRLNQDLYDSSQMFDKVEVEFDFQDKDL